MSEAKEPLQPLQPPQPLQLYLVASTPSTNSTPSTLKKDSKIYIAGHRGMVGSAIHRHLVGLGFENFIFRTSSELDLRDQRAVNEFFEVERPDYVFLAAAKVGGILANNNYRADFIYQNIMIEANVIHAAYATGVKKLLFLGSSCIYPKMVTLSGPPSH